MFMSDRFSRYLSLFAVVILLPLVFAGCAGTPTPAAAPPTTENTGSTETVQPTEAPEPTEAPTEPTAAPEPTEAPTESAAAPATESEEPVTLVVGMSFDFDTLDPGFAFATGTRRIHNATYNQLVTLAPGDISKVVPDLAESWEISDDGTVYTFNLRHGVKFHSGNEMTAKDVKWSYDRFKGLDNKTKFLMEGIKSIEAPDDYTAVITLTEPDPSFLIKATSLEAFSVLDSETVKEHGGVSGPDAAQNDHATEWLNANSAGTGPFILKRWVQETEVVVEKFPDYWEGPAAFDRVIFKHFPETATLALALEAGDVDVAINLSAEQGEELNANPDIDVVSGLGSNMFWLSAHLDPEMSNGILSDNRVRQAIRFAMDYEGLKTLAGSGAVTPPTVITVGLFAVWGEDKATQRDLDKARELLTDAGYPNGFEIDLNYPTAFARAGVDFDILAQKVQADLAEVGITANLKPTDLQTMLDNYKPGESSKFPFVLWVRGRQFPDINNYIDNLPDGAYTQRVGWTDDRADSNLLTLRDAAKTEFKPEQRVEIWDQIQQQLQENGPFISLVQPGERVGLRSNIEGYVYNAQWGVDVYLLSRKN